jgi:hypothetical protein
LEVLSRPPNPFQNQKEGKMEKKKFLTCKRFTSVAFPCPHKDKEVFRKARTWGGWVRGDLTSEDLAKLNGLCLICRDYIEKPKPRNK